MMMMMMMMMMMKEHLVAYLPEIFWLMMAKMDGCVEEMVGLEVAS
jgi:hypothetical protein